MFHYHRAVEYEKSVLKIYPLEGMALAWNFAPAGVTPSAEFLSDFMEFKTFLLCQQCQADDSHEMSIGFREKIIFSASFFLFFLIF